MVGQRGTTNPNIFLSRILKNIPKNTPMLVPEQDAFILVAALRIPLSFKSSTGLHDKFIVIDRQDS